MRIETNRNVEKFKHQNIKSKNNFFLQKEEHTLHVFLFVCLFVYNEICWKRKDI